MSQLRRTCLKRVCRTSTPSCIRRECSATRAGSKRPLVIFCIIAKEITPAIAAWIEGVDKERLEIVKSLGLEPTAFIDIFHQAGLTSAEARASGSIYRAIHESEPNFKIKSPAVP